MKRICIFLILFVNIFNVFSQNGETTNMVHIGMVDPTENEDAMNAYNLGTKYLDENNLDEALVQLELALEYDPEFVDAMDHLGLVYRRLGKYEEAEIIYLKSMELMSANPAVYTNLGNLYRLEGRLEDARQIYIKLMELDKENPEAYYGIGVVYHAAGYYEDSILYFNVAMQIYAENDSCLIFDAIYMQGKNYDKLKNYSEALKFYRIALTAYSNDEQLIDRINEIEKLELFGNFSF